MLTYSIKSVLFHEYIPVEQIFEGIEFISHLAQARETVQHSMAQSRNVLVGAANTLFITICCKDL